MSKRTRMFMGVRLTLWGVNSGLSIKVVSAEYFHKLTSPFVSISPLFVPPYHFFWR